VSGSASYKLFHHPFDPSSRRVRLALAEKGQVCELVSEKPWEPSPDLLALDPCASLPLLVISEGKNTDILADGTAICEYLDETHAAESLLGKNPFQRAEVRRLVGWFETKFFLEVTGPLVCEKAIKRLCGQGQPDSNQIRAACHNIHTHLNYIGWLAERRNWLGGEVISFADLAAGAELSIIDYLGDVPWDSHVMAKEWYARLKSRPSFRGLLGDRVAGFLPPKHYADLDF
jgi:glutathione S-transferase